LNHAIGHLPELSVSVSSLVSCQALAQAMVEPAQDTEDDGPTRDLWPSLQVPPWKYQGNNQDEDGSQEHAHEQSLSRHIP